MTLFRYSFANPEAFVLVGLLPLVWLWQWRQRRRHPSGLWVSGVPAVQNLPLQTYAMRYVPEFFRACTWILLVMALARPQVQRQNPQKLPVEGIDIMLAMDVSRSMEAEDLKPNRLEAARKAAQSFVAARPNDRIGLVVYAGESLTICPPTTQHVLLQHTIQQVNDELLTDGTAIGLGLATAVNRLKDSRVKSKIIILLTDGENNAGFIDPLTATEMAKRLHLKVYTIGVGKTGLAPFPVRGLDGRKVYQQVPFRINEPLLRQMAAQTGGAFFRADSRQSLLSIYQTINQLEKSNVRKQVNYLYVDIYTPLLLGALLFLLLEIILRYGIARRLV